LGASVSKQDHKPCIIVALVCKEVKMLHETYTLWAKPSFFISGNGALQSSIAASIIHVLKLLNIKNLAPLSCTQLQQPLKEQ
jgi:hypothetical protein